MGVRGLACFPWRWMVWSSSVSVGWFVKTKKKLLLAGFALTLLSVIGSATGSEYVLGPGDIVRIIVYEHPDLTTVARIGDSGNITFPLLGKVTLGQSTITDAESRLVESLKNGGFVRSPQVSLLVEEFRSKQVSVLGEVNQPGKYPIDGSSTTVVDFLALAGGLTAQGADSLKLIKRGGQGEQTEIDLVAIFRQGDLNHNTKVEHGDIIYVPIMDRFYIYGEVREPGVYRLERNMTLMQALSVAGGLTGRGTERGVKVNRRGEDGTMMSMDATSLNRLMPDDVIYVKESLF